MINEVMGRGLLTTLVAARVPVAVDPVHGEPRKWAGAKAPS
jgi:hypothetical protein